MWPFTLNVIDNEKGTEAGRVRPRYRGLKPSRGIDRVLVARSLRRTGRRLVRLADRLEAA